VNVFVDLLFEVKAELVIEFHLYSVAPQQGVQARSNIAE